jgi:hypothetical protein
MEQKIPRLYSYAKNKNISVAHFHQNNQFEQQFHVPLSVKAFQEYQEMHDIIQQTQISNEAKDILCYLWGNASYSASKFYHLPYKMCNLQGHSYGFGSPVVQTKSGCSLGYCLWIDLMLETS